MSADDWRFLAVFSGFALAFAAGALALARHLASSRRRKRSDGDRGWILAQAGVIGCCVFAGLCVALVVGVIVLAAGKALP